MQKIIFILIAFIYTTLCVGQTLENDSIYKEILNNKLKINDNKQLYPQSSERHIFNDKISSENKYNPHINNYSNNLQPSHIQMNTQIPNSYQGPVYNYLSNSGNPYNNDYNYSAEYKLSNRSWLNTQSIHNSFLTIGSISNINARYNYKITDDFMVSAGTYIAGYHVQDRFNSKSYNDLGINSSLKYTINNRIAIHAFGQYSVFAKKNKFDPSGVHQGLFPQTHYGGAFEYKLTDRFGIMGGMKRELNPMTGKWNNTPFVVPVFYSK